jgi:hypothetical protein
MAVINSVDIVQFAAREGNEFIRNQLNMKAPLFAALDKVPMKGKLAIINVAAGGLNSTSQVADFGALPSEDGAQPVQGTVSAVGYVSVLGLGRIALATLAGVEDSVDLLDTQLQTVASDMSRQIGTALFSSDLGSPTAVLPAGATPFATGGPGGVGTIQLTFTNVNGASGFRAGQAYGYTRGPSPSNLCATLSCRSVVFTGDATAVVTLQNNVVGFSTLATHTNAQLDAGFGALLITDSVLLRGRTPGTGNATGAGTVITTASPVSLNDIIGSGALHGIDPTTQFVDWTGNDITGGVPTAELMQRAAMRVYRRSGDMPSHLVMSPSAFVVYCQAQLTPVVTSVFTTAVAPGGAGAVRKNLEGKLDKYGRNADPSGSGVEFMGRPVVVDPNCPEIAAYLINKDWVKVGEWQKMQAEDEGGSPLLLSRTAFSKSVQYSAIYNLVCRKRNAHARINSLTVV